MMLKKLEDLPEFMRVDEIRPYWEILNRKKGTTVTEKSILFIPMVAISVCVKMESVGPAFYRQERITICGHLYLTRIPGATDEVK
ncbi:hypothetical protein [Clostridium sp. Marseille-P3244]|uniref:hypothetical protein n=1 Tax=Clostridium sp. Marseille-P3244 TaxID=1871020 RepID=UPI00093180BB|nr:hypothetical protein [Clostridium sp. Marseille-P3244]